MIIKEASEEETVRPRPGSDTEELRAEVEQRKSRIREKEESFAKERRDRLFNRDNERPNNTSEESEESEEEEDIDDFSGLDDDDDTSVAKDTTEEVKEESSEEEEEEFDVFDDLDEDGDDGDETKDEDNDPEGDRRAINAAWRKRVQEQGRKRVEAEARVAELETTLDELTTKVRELEEQKKNISTSNINWGSHEQVKPKWAEFDNIIIRGAQSFSDADTAKKFRQDSQSELLTEYYNLTTKARTTDERLEADIQFKRDLADRYDVEDGGPLLSAVRDAMEKYIEIQDTVDELKAKHEEGRLSFGVKQYEESIRPYEELFEDMGNVDSEIMEAEPHSVASIVGKKYTEDTEFKAKAEKYKDRVKQFVFGLRPLTQEEINRAEVRANARGLSVTEYLELRDTNYHKQRAKFLNDVFLNGMAMDEFPEMRRVYDRYLANKQKRESARKAISKAKPASAEEKTKPAKKVRAIDQPYVPPSRRKFS